MNSTRIRQEQDEILRVRFSPSQRPLRILGVAAWRALWSMGRGAGATAFMRSPVALAAAGHDLHVVHPSPPGDEGRHEFAGVHFHRYRAPEVFSNPDLILPARLFERAWRYGYYQIDAPRHVMRVARELEPDLVIAYGIMTAPVASRVARQLGCPLVGRYFGNTLSLGLNKRSRWWGNFMERIGFRVPVQAMILTNDGSPILEVLRRLRVDLRPVHFWRNGLPEGVFTPGPRPEALAERLGIARDAFVMMTVTRLAPEKRLDRALYALAALRGDHPEAMMILLGDGPERARLERLAGRLGVLEAVRFPGPVPNADLADWYRVCDVVLSLLDRTNASNPVFEAMACERCVVALDVGTTAEIVRDGQTGVLIHPQRESELPRVLEDLIRDPRRRTAIGQRARPFILDACGTVKTRMERELAVIEQVARSGSVVPGNLVD
jgi:glycosyltransferase involved in cell wall biosynthesis